MKLGAIRRKINQLHSMGLQECVEQRERIVRLMDAGVVENEKVACSERARCK